MKIHWTTPIPPELASFSPDDRKRIWRECSRSQFWTRTTFLRSLVAGLGAGCGAITGDMIGPGYGIWGAGIGGGIGGFFAGQLAIRQTLEVVRERYGPASPSASIHP